MQENFEGGFDMSRKVKAFCSALLVIAVLVSITLPAVADVTVYITNTGKKYHATGCRHLAKSRISISLSDAKAKGFAPCSVCSPPN